MSLNKLAHFRYTVYSGKNQLTLNHENSQGMVSEFLIHLTEKTTGDSDRISHSESVS